MVAAPRKSHFLSASPTRRRTIIIMAICLPCCLSLYLLLMDMIVPIWTHNYQNDLKAADNAYQAGDKEKAKKLYLKAAAEGSAEAHFELACRYVWPWPNKEGLSHFIEAAQKGHGEALRYALDGLLFRADSLKSADP